MHRIAAVRGDDVAVAVYAVRLGRAVLLPILDLRQGTYTPADVRPSHNSRTVRYDLWEWHMVLSMNFNVYRDAHPWGMR